MRNKNIGDEAAKLEMLSLSQNNLQTAGVIKI